MDFLGDLRDNGDLFLKVLSMKIANLMAMVAASHCSEMQATKGE